MLNISIFDKGTFGPSLIGRTIIDLENRHFANVLWRDRQALKIAFDQHKADTKAMGKIKDKKKQKLQKKRLKAKADQNRKYKKIIANVEQILIPVDFRELTHPAKSQA